MKCEICGKEFKHLGLHLNYKHKDISHKEYYDKYLKQEGEGFCFTCGNPVKFYDLSHGYQHYCNAKCELADKKIIEKAKTTYKERTGYEHNMHNPESKKRVKNTTIEKYGGIGFAVKELAEKSIKTFNENHNLNIKYAHNIVHEIPELEKQRINTRIKNNNGQYASPEQIKKLIETSHMPEINKKRVNTRREKYGDRYISNKAYEKMQESPYKTYSYANMKLFNKDHKNLCICHCDICNNDYEIELRTLRTRHSAGHILCTICNPLEKQYSILEKELFEFIKNNYNKEILENDRNILENREIDIYLPELKIGFEFDGTFWHADPRFYKPDDLIKEQTAAQIWEKDEAKNKLAESLGIKLIRIKEYDWINDNDNIKKYILEILSTN